MIGPIEYDKLKDEGIPFEIVRTEPVPVSLDNVSVTIKVPAFHPITGKALEDTLYVVSMAELDNQIKGCKAQMEALVEKMDGYAQMKADILVILSK